MGNTKEDIMTVALYRHYRSKRDIFDHIVRRMEQQDGEQAEQHDMPEECLETKPEAYQKLSFEEFLGYSKSMFAYWTEDKFASSFRKMLTLEQFRNEEMQKSLISSFILLTSNRLLTIIKVTNG